MQGSELAQRPVLFGLRLGLGPEGVRVPDGRADIAIWRAAPVERVARDQRTLLEIFPAGRGDKVQFGERDTRAVSWEEVGTENWDENP